jgi:hypothetical protein
MSPHNVYILLDRIGELTASKQLDWIRAEPRGSGEAEAYEATYRDILFRMVKYRTKQSWCYDDKEYNGSYYIEAMTGCLLHMSVPALFDLHLRIIELVDAKEAAERKANRRANDNLENARAQYVLDILDAPPEERTT